MHTFIQDFKHNKQYMEPIKVVAIENNKGLYHLFFLYLCVSAHIE